MNNVLFYIAVFIYFDLLFLVLESKVQFFCKVLGYLCNHVTSARRFTEVGCGGEFILGRCTWMSEHNTSEQ